MPLLLLSLLSVPLVQLFGIYLRDPWSHGGKSLSLLLFGGVRHLVFTLVSWFLWVVSVVFAAPVVHPSFVDIHQTHVRVFHGAAVALSVISLFFNIKAVFLFNSPSKNRSGNRKRIFLKRWASPDVGFVTVLVMGLILSVMSALFLGMTDSLPDVPSKLLYCSISIICSLTAAGTTHGLGGFLRHGQTIPSQHSWKFFQPFVGGRIFIATQALGWSLFSLSLVFFIAVVRHIVKGVAIAIRIWALASGGTAVITQLVLAISLLTFRPGSKERWMPLIKQSTLENLPVLLMYTPVHLVCTSWVLSFTLLPTLHAMTLWTVIITCYYYLSNRGHPSQTGCRRWPRFQNFIEQYVEASLDRWFGGARVINSEGKKLNSNERYIYGYHPHGMYPAGAGFLRCLKDFREKVCDRLPTSLCATALFIPPVLRDILCWYGFREVSRKSFVNALREDGSVMLCPGGQEEMVESYRSLRNPGKIVLCSRHRGFCRLAIQEQASLVPVLSLGEIFTLQNAFNIPSLQKMTYKWLGFPIPYLLVGRWLLSPLPKRVPLVFVVGQPIQPPKIAQDDPKFEEEVSKLHEQFFRSLISLFDKHKGDHPWYENATMIVQ